MNFKFYKSEKIALYFHSCTFYSKLKQISSRQPNKREMIFTNLCPVSSLLETRKGISSLVLLKVQFQKLNFLDVISQIKSILRKHLIAAVQNHEYWCVFVGSMILTEFKRWLYLLVTQIVSFFCIPSWTDLYCLLQASSLVQTSFDWVTLYPLLTIFGLVLFCFVFLSFRQGYKASKMQRVTEF